MVGEGFGFIGFCVFFWGVGSRMSNQLVELRDATVAARIVRRPGNAFRAMCNKLLIASVTVQGRGEAETARLAILGTQKTKVEGDRRNGGILTVSSLQTRARRRPCAKRTQSAHRPSAPCVRMQRAGKLAASAGHCGKYATAWCKSAAACWKCVQPVGCIDKAAHIREKRVARRGSSAAACARFGAIAETLYPGRQAGRHASWTWRPS